MTQLDGAVCAFCKGKLQRETAWREEGGFHKQRAWRCIEPVPSRWLSANAFHLGVGFVGGRLAFIAKVSPGESALCSKAGVPGSPLPERQQEAGLRMSSSIWFVAAVISGSGEVVVPAGSTQSPAQAPPSSPLVLVQHAATCHPSSCLHERQAGCRDSSRGENAREQDI